MTDTEQIQKDIDEMANMVTKHKPNDVLIVLTKEGWVKNTFKNDVLIESVNLSKTGFKK